MFKKKAYNIADISKFYDAFYYPEFENMPTWHRIVIDYLAEHKQYRGSLLDIGCYRGNFFRDLLRKVGRDANRLSGIDISKECIKNASKYTSNLYNINLMNEKEMKILKSYSFNIVVATEIIEHLPNLDILFKTVVRILEQEGLFIVSFPNYLNIARYLRKKIAEFFKKPNLMYLQPIENELTYFSMRKKICSYGFSLLEVRSGLYFPFGIKLFEGSKIERLFNMLGLHRLSFCPVLIFKKI